MDSLTQIVLGAAVGEIALGRKIGNRALIWGGIGGTIPDLDVLGNFFLDSIDALAFHRGISHSIFFSIVIPLLLAWLVHNTYDRRIHKTWPYKIAITLLNAVILVSLVWGINYLFMQDGAIRWWLLIATGLIAVYLLWRLYKFYLRKDLEEPQTSFREWYWLFFLALATHWILDCFTAYGTQIFMPFSDFRVAFNNIAVVDPLYTVPFLICVIIVSTLKRNTKKRAFFNWLGIGISSFYMLLTILNKFHVDNVFEKALFNRKLEVERCHCSPTILNNFLWSCVAESKDEFYVGQYSIFDSDPNLHHLNVITKNDSIHEAFLPLEDYQTLLWFSNDHLVAFPTDSVVILSDIRYGGMQDTISGPKDLIFNFEVHEENGEMIFTESRERPEGEISDQLRRFIKRMKGY